MIVEFIGTVTSVFKMREFGEKKIQERKFRCDEYTPNSNEWKNPFEFAIKFDPTKDRYYNIPDLDNLSAGDKVRFSFNIKGRLWTAPSNEVRCYSTFTVCSPIEKLRDFKSGEVIWRSSPRKVSQQQAAAQDAPQPESPSGNAPDGVAEDIPF